MKTKAINTRYGVIFSRNALIIRKQELSINPLQLDISVALSLKGCRPPLDDEREIEAHFCFYDISSLSVYRLDDYPYEKFSCSSFDEVEDTSCKPRQRIILSTYDYVFDIVGQYQIDYTDPAK